MKSCGSRYEGRILNKEGTTLKITAGVFLEDGEGRLGRFHLNDVFLFGFKLQQGIETYLVAIKKRKKERLNDGESMLKELIGGRMEI